MESTPASCGQCRHREAALIAPEGAEQVGPTGFPLPPSLSPGAIPLPLQGKLFDVRGKVRTSNGGTYWRCEHGKTPARCEQCRHQG